MWLYHDEVAHFPAHTRNPHIQQVEANHRLNKQGYEVLVYQPLDNSKPLTVVQYEGHWHKCPAEAKTYRPFLGPQLPEVEYYDKDIFDEEPTEQPTGNPSASKREDEADTEI